jgi:hypothetical protein
MIEEFNKVYEKACNHILFELHLPEDKNFMNKTKEFFEKVKALDKKMKIGEKTAKNLYFLSSELVQAVVHNGVFDTELFENNLKLSYFDNRYYLISQNLTPTSKIDRVNTKFIEVNSCFDSADTEEQLQIRIKYKIKNTPMTKRGVSVGVLDLARRSMNKLLYDFKAITADYSIFTIICTVDIDLE